MPTITDMMTDTAADTGANSVSAPAPAPAPTPAPTPTDLAALDCERPCPVQRAALLLEGKWTTLIIRDLLGGKRRFSELQRGLAGISPRLLTSRLRLLEQEGLVLRYQYPTIPPTTEYELSDLGRELIPVLTAMAVLGARLQARDAEAAGPVS